MIKRVTYKLRKGDVLIVQEYHDGKYGAKGLPRKKKKKATKEDIARVGIHKKQILKVESDESWIECYRRATESLVEWERTEEQEAKVS